MTPANQAVPHTIKPAQPEPAPPVPADAARAELEHPHAVHLAEQRARRELADLAEQCPGHLLAIECYPGRARRYVARAKPGTSASPWLVITEDLGELRAALTAPQRHARSAE